LRGVERDPAAERDPDAPPGSLAADAAEGIRVVWADTRLRALAVANFGMAVSFGTGGAAFLVYVNQVLGFGPGVLGLIFALGGATSFVGAVVAGRIAFLPIGPVMVACFVAAAVGTALAPLATSAGVVGVALLVAQQFVSDPAWTILDINAVSLRQAVTADEALGRVNATFRVGDVGGQIVGTLVGGYVGDAFGARAALWIGVVALLVGAAWLAASPVRNLRRLPTDDHLGARA
jgi:MFS family permease